MLLTWHEYKRQLNLKKHGVDFEDGEIHIISMREAEKHETRQFFSHV